MRVNCSAEFVPEVERRGGDAKLGWSGCGHRVRVAGVDFGGAVSYHAPHYAEAGQNGNRFERASGTDLNARADFAGRHAAKNFHDGE